MSKQKNKELKKQTDRKKKSFYSVNIYFGVPVYFGFGAETYTHIDIGMTFNKLNLFNGLNLVAKVQSRRFFDETTEFENECSAYIDSINQLILMEKVV